MSFSRPSKKQDQIDNQKAALIDASRESDAKRLEEKIGASLGDAMDSIIMPPVDDFRPPEVITAVPLTPAKTFTYKPPIEKTQEQQDAEAILKSLPETMRPDNYRKIQVNTKSTVIDQIDALEKIYAVVGEAISKRKLMVKGIDAALGIMDGKTPAKPTQAKKPAATTTTTSKRRGRKPAAKVEAKKPAKGYLQKVQRIEKTTRPTPITKKVEEKKTD